MLYRVGFDRHGAARHAMNTFKKFRRRFLGLRFKKSWDKTNQQSYAHWSKGPRLYLELVRSPDQRFYYK